MQCEPGWLEFNSKCYYFSSDNDYTWTEAAAVCTDLSSIATLTSVTSQEEQKFLLGVISYILELLIIHLAPQITLLLILHLLGAQMRTLKVTGPGLTTRLGDIKTSRRESQMEIMRKIALKWSKKQMKTSQQDGGMTFIVVMEKGAMYVLIITVEIIF